MDGWRDQREMDGDFLSHTILTSRNAIMVHGYSSKWHRIVCEGVEACATVSDLCLLGQYCPGNNSSLRESFSLLKRQRQSTQRAPNCSTSTPERQNGLYSKPTSLLHSLSTRLNRKPFQNLYWEC